MKEDFCLLIIYSDGSTKIVENVENYGFKHESGLSTLPKTISMDLFQESM